MEFSATTDSLDDFAGLNISQVLELVVERGNPLDIFNFMQASITTPEVGTFYYTVDKFAIQERVSAVPLPSAAWLFLTAMLALLRARDGGSILTADPA